MRFYNIPYYYVVGSWNLFNKYPSRFVRMRMPKNVDTSLADKILISDKPEIYFLMEGNQFHFAHLTRSQRREFRRNKKNLSFSENCWSHHSKIFCRQEIPIIESKNKSSFSSIHHHKKYIFCLDNKKSHLFGVVPHFWIFWLEPGPYVHMEASRIWLNEFTN